MEWNEVTAPKKKQSRKPKNNEDDDAYHFGGGFQGGHLKAGAVMGASTGKGKRPVEHHASVVAAADYLGDENEEIKYELVSHEVSLAV
jgi:hypothetical protein